MWIMVEEPMNMDFNDDLKATAGVPTPVTGLERLRQEIDQTDRQLVALLAQRRGLVMEVAEVKKERGLPTHHPAREEDLISSRRAQAQEAGLDPDYIEDLFRTVMRNSRVGQLDTLGRRSVRPGARVLIVGGRGSMGRLFARCFTQSDYLVRILDVEDWPQVAELASGIDLALLAVPIQVSPSVALQLGPHLPPNCVLCDITSLKKEPLEAMLRAHAGPVTGLHPLFGPGTVSMDKQIVVVSPGRDGAACQWLLDQLAVWGNVLVEAEAGEHDRTMGIVQALRHFATFAFGEYLCGRQVPISRTLEVSSPIYRLELGMVGRLFAQDPALYAEIIFATPERRVLLRDFIESLNRHLEMVDRGDKQAFINQFQKVAAWFGPFSEQAMRESNFLIEKLVHRF
jgi:chorismate mutase/prephenate dehydrogenase